MRLHPAGVSEYDLIQAVQHADGFSGNVSANHSLALFQKHFTVMHCLYRLQSQYSAQGFDLTISPLNIQVLPAAGNDMQAQQMATSSGQLQEFYLDWNNYMLATPDTVTELLRSFWQRYAALDKTMEAFQALDLDPESTWSQVQRQYRRLINEYHPDKGGDGEKFNQVRDAYETLKRVKFKL